ncbi:MAG: hypothetical protein ABEJ40_06610 [Haloarculaceae archaeon]
MTGSSLSLFGGGSSLVGGLAEGHATVNSRNFGTLLENACPNGNFTLSAGGWNAGAPMGAVPYFSLRHVLVENFRGFGYGYDPASETRGGSKADVTVPKIGGGEMTVNPPDRLSTLSQTTDESKAHDIALEQAWVTNVDLPMIPIAERTSQVGITDDDWDIPENPKRAEICQTD